MATFGATKTAIARRLVDTSHTAVTDVEIGEAINEAIRFWKQKRFWFNSTSSPLSIAAGDSTITLPSDYLMEIPTNALTVTQNGYPYVVKKESPLIFDTAAGSSYTGRPLIYCSRVGRLDIAPVADIDYDGLLYYIKDYTDFETDGSEDNQSNDFLDEGLDLTRNHALARLHGELRQDDKMEAVYMTRVAQAYESLLGRTNRMLKTGTITVEQ